MKLSLKFQDEPQQSNQSPILKAKIPVTVFNQPFISSTSATTAGFLSDLSFSLSTNFPSGPSLKLSYCPTTAATPFSLSLRSGLGLFGSPNNSPLAFSVHFSLSQTSTLVPIFSLHFKPQLGHFSLKKSTFSDPGSDQVSGPLHKGGDKVNFGSFSNGGINLDSGSHSKGEFGNVFVPSGSSGWQEVKLEPCSSEDGGKNVNHMENCGAHSDVGIGFMPQSQLAWKNSAKDGFLSGVAVMARTELPITKTIMVKSRWGVNFPSDLGKRLPYLTVSKIGIERVQPVEVEKNSDETKAGDSELLKGMCFWMRRDLEVLQNENRELSRSLEEMRTRISEKNFQSLEETRTRTSDKNFRGNRDDVGKKVSPPSSESSSGFEQWRKKKNGGEDNGQKEQKKSSNRPSDIESELERAIKAASS